MLKDVDETKKEIFQWTYFTNLIFLIVSIEEKCILGQKYEIRNWND
jgi:hypothetical protein